MQAAELIDMLAELILESDGSEFDMRAMSNEFAWEIVGIGVDEENGAINVELGARLTKAEN